MPLHNSKMLGLCGVYVLAYILNINIDLNKLSNLLGVFRGCASVLITNVNIFLFEHKMIIHVIDMTVT